MIKIAFFDVGETLIHDGQPFPAVTAALAAIAGFETSAGEPLILSIISDISCPIRREPRRKSLHWRNNTGTGCSGRAG